MAASRISDGSVVRAGLGHVALSLSVFGMLGAGAVGAAFVFGDEAAGAPRVELALYSEQNGPPPLLKNRSPLDALDANALRCGSSNGRRPVSRHQPIGGLTRARESPSGDGHGDQARRQAVARRRYAGTGSTD